jgi:glutaconyl-CoA/methylmalonyl-CoA decarboxylase subunit delta
MRWIHLVMQLPPMEEGFVILIVGIMVVFSSLFSLFILFEYGVPMAMRLFERFRTKKRAIDPLLKAPSATASGEEIAAVAAAVYLVLTQSHDEENAILTISKAKKDYSPWSSKIYMTHHVPTKQR